MLKIVGIMLLGVFTGYLLKNYQLRWVQKWIMLAIWLLLFLLGIAVGTNGEIMNNLDTIGLKGLILALGGVSGSVTFCLRNCFSRILVCMFYTG